jgi:hypothetical protein
LALAERLQALVRDRDVAAVSIALVSAATPSERASPLCAERLARVHQLVNEFQSDPAGPLAFRFAHQAELRAGLVISVTRGLRGLQAAGRGQDLRQAPLTESGIAEVRAITLVDVACVFDLSAMAQAALHLACYLLEQAVADRRRDDYLVARRLSDLYLASPMAEGSERVSLFAAHLYFAKEAPILSTDDRDEREMLVRWLASRIEALRAEAPIPDALVDLLDDTQRAVSADQRGPIVGRSVETEARRFQRAYLATGVPDHIEDLTQILRLPEADETPRKRAERLNELGNAYEMLGRFEGRTDALEAAMMAHRDALEGAVPGPLTTQIRADSAAAYLGWMIAEGQDVMQGIGVLRQLLPAPDDAREAESAVRPGCAHATLASIELIAASAFPVDPGPLVAAATASRVALLHLDPARVDEVDLAELARAAAQALADARGGGTPAEDACARLAEAISTGDAWGVPTFLANLAATEIIARHPAARPAFQQALLAADETSAVVRMIAEIRIADGDLLSGPTTRLRVLSLLARAHGLASEIGDLSQLAAVWHEGAASLVEAGELGLAAAICELACAPVPLANPQPDANTSMSRVVLVGGRDVTFVLARPAGGTWAKIANGAPLDRHSLAASNAVLSEAPHAFAWRSLLEAGLASADALLGDDNDPWSATMIVTAPIGVTATPLTGRSGVTEVRVLGAVAPPLLTTLDATLTTPSRAVVVAACGRGQELSAMAPLQRDIEAVALCGAVPHVMREMTDWASVKILQAAQIVHCCGAFVTDDQAIGLRTWDGGGFHLERTGLPLLDSPLLVTVLGAVGDHAAASAPEVVDRGAAALLASGARHVIASAWPVRATPADLFSAALYDALGHRQPVPTAFAAGIEAIREYKVDGWQPYRAKHWWAGISLYAATPRF